jgi:hypothetical protein
LSQFYHFLSLREKFVFQWKGPFSCIPFPLTQDGFHFFTDLPWIWVTFLLATCPLTIQLPHAAHISPEEGDNMYTWNVGIRLQGTRHSPGDCSVTMFVFVVCDVSWYGLCWSSWPVPT